MSNNRVFRAMRQSVLPFVAVFAFAVCIAAQDPSQVKINEIYSGYSDQYDKTSFNLVAMPVKVERALLGTVNLFALTAGKVVKDRPETMILTVVWVDKDALSLPAKIDANVLVDGRSVMARSIDRFDNPGPYNDGYSAGYPIKMPTETFAAIATAKKSVKITLGDRSFIIEKDGVAKLAAFLAAITPSPVAPVTTPAPTKPSNR